MGWKSDWLYRLIFQEINRLEAQARKQGAVLGPLPATIRVREYADADLDLVVCRGPVKRSWLLTNGQVSELQCGNGGDSPQDDGDSVGKFFATPLIAFHISPDRKQVLLTHFFGPHYAAGKVASVEGQGKRGRLAFRDGPGWIS